MLTVAPVGMQGAGHESESESTAIYCKNCAWLTWYSLLLQMGGGTKTLP